MGKRTKFQVKELAQLTLTVNSHTRENNTNLLTSHECCNLPKVSYLQSGTRISIVTKLIKTFLLSIGLCA